MWEYRQAIGRGTWKATLLLRCHMPREAKAPKSGLANTLGQDFECLSETGSSSDDLWTSRNRSRLQACSWTHPGLLPSFRACFCDNSHTNKKRCVCAISLQAEHDPCLHSESEGLAAKRESLISRGHARETAQPRSRWQPQGHHQFTGQSTHLTIIQRYSKRRNAKWHSDTQAE